MGSSLRLEALSEKVQFAFDTATNVSIGSQGLYDMAVNGANFDNVMQTAGSALGLGVNLSVLRNISTGSVSVGLPDGVYFEGEVFRAVNPDYVDTAWDNS